MKGLLVNLILALIGEHESGVRVQVLQVQQVGDEVVHCSGHPRIDLIVRLLRLHGEVHGSGIGLVRGEGSLAVGWLQRPRLVVKHAVREGHMGPAGGRAVSERVLRLRHAADELGEILA